MKTRITNQNAYVEASEVNELYSSEFAASDSPAEWEERQVKHKDTVESIYQRVESGKLYDEKNYNFIITAAKSLLNIKFPQGLEHMEFAMQEPTALCVCFKETGKICGVFISSKLSCNNKNEDEIYSDILDEVTVEAKHIADKKINGQCFKIITYPLYGTS